MVEEWNVEAFAEILLRREKIVVKPTRFKTWEFLDFGINPEKIIAKIQIHFVNQFTIIKSYKVARCHFCFIFAASKFKPVVFEDLKLTIERFQN